VQFVAAYFYPAFMLPGLRKIVSRLKAKPVVRVPPSGLFQPDRHFRRYTGMAVKDARKRMAGNAKRVRRFRYAQA
jgi:hypothetical protein